MPANIESSLAFEPGVGRGVTFGVVVEVDADNPLLVKVSVDDMEISGEPDADVGDWCEVMTPFAGAGRGFYAPPRVGDRVVVAFYNGQSSRGVVLGSLWGRVDDETTHKAPVTDDGTRPITALYSTPVDPDKGTPGHQIVLDDTKDKEAIRIIDRTGKNSIVIDSKKNTLTILIEGDVTITAKKSFTVNSPDAAVTFKCKTFTVEASGDTAIGGANVNVEASSALGLKGSSGVNVEGATDINKGALKVMQ